MPVKSEEYLRSVVRELIKLPAETEWVEFKCNNQDPERIAKYISGLSNAATLWSRPNAYIVWGLDDSTHKICGTDFEYRKARKGNEELEAWLTKMINPKINFHFYEVYMENEKKVTLLEIPCAEREPTKFKSTAMIRVGSNLNPILKYPEKEHELWRRFDTTIFELRIAMYNVSREEVIHLMDFSRYYDALRIPIPENHNKIMEDFCHEKFIRKNDAGNYDITNFGVLMIGKNFRDFEGLNRRAVRVIRYKNTDRLDGISEREFSNGYVFSHEEIVQYIMAVIPQREVLEGTIRQSEYAFPEIAVRELLTNIMVHQAIDQRGTSPMVEIFSDRIEFSNSGAPLVDVNRIVDTVPISRNENMAGFMHKCGICEERGSGYDKIIRETGKNQLPAPKIINQDNLFTKVVMFGKTPFDILTKEDRIRTCYMQACLAYVEFRAISNKDIRLLFDLDNQDRVKASRIIKEAINAGLIKPVDPNTAPRYMKYIPAWA